MIWSLKKWIWNCFEAHALNKIKRDKQWLCFTRFCFTGKLLFRGFYRLSLCFWKWTPLKKDKMHEQFRNILITFNLPCVISLFYLHLEWQDFQCCGWILIHLWAAIQATVDNNRHRCWLAGLVAHALSFYDVSVMNSVVFHILRVPASFWQELVSAQSQCPNGISQILIVFLTNCRTWTIFILPHRHRS